MKTKRRIKPLQDHEIDGLLVRFAQPDLSLDEAQETLDRLQSRRRRVLDRLLEMLHALVEVDRTDGKDTSALCAAYPAVKLMTLLGYLGDVTLIDPLLAMVEDKAVSDDLKLRLIALIGQFDPEIQGLFEHLEDPYGALQRSQLQHLHELTTPADVATWLDIMQEHMPPEMRIAFVRSCADLDDRAVVSLLIGSCYDPDDEVVLAAMDAVERLKDARALPALEELAAHHPSPAVRSEARKTADRLCIRATLVPQVEPLALPPLQACYLTTIDGQGGQAALIVRRSSDQELGVIHVAFDDQEGIQECFGSDVHPSALPEILDTLVEQGLSPVLVSHAVCLAVLEQAREWTWQAGVSPPASFVVWREWLEGLADEGLADEGLADEGLGSKGLADGGAPERAPLVVPAEQRDLLLDRCHELLLQDEFLSWLFEPDEIEQLQDAYLDLLDESDGAIEVPALRALLRQGVEEAIDDRQRALIRERLRREAPLLRALYEDDLVWQWAVVAADALQEDSPLPPQDHPLLLGMVACSLEYAFDETIDWLDVV